MTRASHRSTTQRHQTRRRLIAVVGLAALAGGVVAVFAVRDIERFCGRPDDLRTSDIVVVQSYRTCAEQRMACERICGSRRGCPGLCAPPGFSWHQRALAIDITQDMLDSVGVIQALEANGWCQPLPGSDPGHFSYDGCH
jgi:hypothetical protein